MEEIIKKYWLYFFSVIFFIGGFLRVYQLTDVPNGLYQDETAIGYNAYSILTTGKDEYGKSFPLYFKSFGDYKLPVYVYLTTVPVKLFGLSDVAPRVVSAFFSILSVGIFFFFVKRLTSNTLLALLSMLILAINPWHLHYGRATFEVSVALFFFIVGGWLLLNKKITLLTGIFGIVCFVIALYTYNLTRLLAPLILLLFVCYKREDFLQKSFFHKAIFVFVFLVCLVPFLLTFANPEGINSASGTLIHSSAAIQSRLLEIRSFMMYTPEIFQKVFFSTYPQTLWEYINHILSYFSVDFFFIKGSPHGNHGIGNFAQFYPVEFITITFGIIIAFIKKQKWIWVTSLWAMIIILVASLTREAPHATRSFFLVVPLVIFSAYGALEILRFLQKQKKIYKAIGVLSLLFFTFYSIVYYFASYYERFPVVYASKWNSEDKKVAEYISKNEQKYEKIVVDDKSGLVYTSLLYYLAYDPSEFQRTAKRKADDTEGFSKVESFGKFEFREIDWSKDSALQNTLFITTDKNVLDEKLVVEKISYPQRPVVINVGQIIHQFPVTDSAYVLLETN